MVNPKDNFFKKRNIVTIKLVSGELAVDNSHSKKEQHFEQYI